MLLFPPCSLSVHSFIRIELDCILTLNGGPTSTITLTGTLRTYTRSGCDDHTVQLHCPPGTSISVQQAQYGRTPPHTALCHGRQPQRQHADNQLDNSTNCLWSEQLQYSLLQTVVEACQKKRLCQFQTSPRTFGNDPCPGVRKWVEVAYKCRPCK
ncbi:protein eva-1 homolog C-like [Frankliniella occidentalis]|uniref:Protein eva-1 homolog C-like n=1 Tax=Frankliniella occidentalis TaxID=133901 RepID=A0A9C6WKQ6_FRAOC|nr:protein eva-1 homolog C-like [Frankliniella occidentalis]